MAVFNFSYFWRKNGHRLWNRLPDLKSYLGTIPKAMLLARLEKGQTQRFWVIAGFLIFFGLALHTAVAKSITVDEAVHIARGVALWQTDDLHIQTVPRLSHWLIGSLLFLEPQLPAITQLESWGSYDNPSIAREFFWQSAIEVERVLFLARLPIIFVGLGLGALLARWARRYFAQYSLPVVLILFAFSPNLLAFASLATTDLVVTAVYIIVPFSHWHYWQRPSTMGWLLSGISLGLAQGAKLSALLLLPITFLLAYLLWQQNDQLRQKRTWWQVGAVWLSMALVGSVVLWGMYSFETRPMPGTSWPIPATTYIENLFTGQAHLARGHRAYLLGQWSRQGWWSYFVVAYLVKTPVSMLLLLLGTGVLLIKQKLWTETIYLWATALVFFLAASFSRLDIGYRHILPLLPITWLLVARTSYIWMSCRYMRLVFFLCLGWYIIASLRQHPHYLAYFNELVGGSDQGHHYLADSNIDWGQDFSLLLSYAQSQHPNPLYVSYYGIIEPDYYNLAYVPLTTADSISPQLTQANPRPGQYALSVNHLLGLLADPDTFDWFRRHKPDTKLGYSIFIYDIPQAAPGNWIAHCNNPATILDRQMAASLVTTDELRHLYFDCESSWVFPDEGQPGWYILPAYQSWFMEQYFPDHFRQVYHHDATAAAPTYDVYYWDGQVPATEWGIEEVPRLQNGASPVIKDMVQLLGYEVTGSTWATIWQVQQAGPVQPVSIAGHLYGDTPIPAVADGLGYVMEQWQAGDIFWQFHDFEDTVEGQFLETGFYDYSTSERLAWQDGRFEFIRLPLPNDQEASNR